MKLKKEQMVKFYTNMVRVRKLDEWFCDALLTGKLPLFYHSTQIQEAVGVGACTFLREDDYVYATHRGHGISKLIPKGVPMRGIIAEHFGKTSGITGGISGYHPYHMESGFCGFSGIVGEDFGMSAGTALAAKMRGKGQLVVIFAGDATYAKGPFHEAMLLAATWKLPVVYVVENNQMGQYTPMSEYFPMENIADLALGYHVPGVVVDGQDVVAVYEAVQTAVDRARAGEGPSLIECKTYRTHPHAEGIPDFSLSRIRPKEEIEAEAKNRDPIQLFGKKLLKQGILTQAEIDGIHLKAKEEVEEAARLAAQDSPITDLNTLERALYAD